MNRLVKLILVSGLLLAVGNGCRTESAGEKASGKINIRFDFHYRKDTTVQHSVTKELKAVINVVDGPVPEIALDIPAVVADVGEFRVSIQPETNAFYVDVFEKGEKERHVMRQLYQIDSSFQNQFAGRHGFTGLVYVNHAKSGAELQFIGKVDQ